MPLDGHLDVTVTDTAVEFRFSVTNEGSESVGLEFRSGQTADVVVYDSDGEVWRWSDGQMFTQALRTEMLESGTSLTQEYVWEDPTPGRYTAEATLEAANASLLERAEFEV